jgi:hypothetical protein
MNFGAVDNPVLLPEDVTVTTFAGAIDVYENIFSEEIADKLISSFEEANNDAFCPISYNNAKIGFGVDGGQIRSNVTMNLFNHNDITNAPCSCNINKVVTFIQEKLSLFVRHYSIKYDVEIAFDEGLQLLKYGPGKQYKPHVDHGPGGADHRVLSGLIYINPEAYVGGGTHFLNFDTVIQPKKPALALFPSNYAYRHEARPVFEGFKYAIVTWFGPPWRTPPQ